MLDTLLIEDNAIFRHMTRDMLLAQYSSICVGEAADAGEAMDEIGRKCPRIVLMNIQLPGRNGLELTKEIKALSPDVPVVILTSYDCPEYQQAAAEDAVDYCPAKNTAKTDEILESIDTMLFVRYEN